MTTVIDSDKYTVNLFCLNLIDLVVWTFVLVLLVYHLYFQPNELPKIIKISSIIFVLSGVMAWLSFFLFMLLKENNGVFFIIHMVMEYVGQFLAFYAFILSRLKIAFDGSMYALSNRFFIRVISIALVSVSMMAWARLYVTITPIESMFEHTLPFLHFILFCLCQFIVIDAVIRILVIYLFNKKLFDLICLQLIELKLQKTTHFLYLEK